MNITVIIPCYNIAPWLKFCLDSVFSQKIEGMEVIAIDDGSSDETLHILQDYGEAHPNLTVLVQENKGLSSARNAGLGLATGDFVYFLDADDELYDNNVLLLCVDRMQKQGLDVLVGSAAVLYDGPDLEEKYSYFKTRYVIKQVYEGIYKGMELLRALRTNKDYYEPVGLKCYRTSFLKSNGLYFIDGQLHEDTLYTYKSLILAEHAAAVPLYLYKRRIRRDSIMTRGMFPSNVQGILINFMESFRFLEQQRSRIPLDAELGFEPRRSKNAVARWYITLDSEQQKEFMQLLTPDQKFYFDTFIADIIMSKARQKAM